MGGWDGAMGWRVRGRVGWLEVRVGRVGDWGVRSERFSCRSAFCNGVNCMGSMLSVDNVGILKETTVYLTQPHACRPRSQSYMPHV